MAYRRAPISILTLNCKGLNAPEGRTHLLKELKKQHISGGGGPFPAQQIIPEQPLLQPPFSSQIWALNPTGKDFTHYSALHDRYARIDYLFIKQEGSSRLLKATIEPATWSDHSPVWIAIEDQIERALDLYFSENEKEGTVIRGTLIQIASQKKKAAIREMAKLYKTISTLESQHKRHHLNATYALRDLISTRGFFYAHANKGGGPRTQICSLRLTSGARMNLGIFTNPCTTSSRTGGQDRSQHNQALRTEYLNATVMERIDPNSAVALDAPMEEL
ncbi:Hypothetical predicted protein, partial [Pelobates cultripes]